MKTTRPLRRKKELERGAGLSPGCGKTRYTDELAAKLALADIARPDRAREGDEKRAYKCPLCQGWHLTSQPRRPIARERSSGAPPRKTRRGTGPSGRVRALVLQRDGYSCVCCGRSVIGQPYSLQHRDSRGMGGTSDPLSSSPVNLLTMLGTGTTLCHGRVESRQDPEDNAKGYWLRMGEDPALTPVMVFSEHGSGVTVWLTPEGTYSTEPPEGAPA